jgi:hypothetical protein
MSTCSAGAKGVDGPVLLGTPTPVLLGTRVPYYWERARLLTIWRDKADFSSSNFPNSKSFGLLLTRHATSWNCGRGTIARPIGCACLNIIVSRFVRGARP